MEEEDLEGLEALYNQYLHRFKMVPVYNTAEVKHQFFSGRGVGEVGGTGVPGRRDKQVVWTYVVEVIKGLIDCFFTSIPYLPAIRTRARRGLLTSSRSTRCHRRS